MEVPVRLGNKYVHIPEFNGKSAPTQKTMPTYCLEIVIHLLNYMATMFSFGREREANSGKPWPQ